MKSVVKWAGILFCCFLVALGVVIWQTSVPHKTIKLREYTAEGTVDKYSPMLVVSPRLAITEPEIVHAAEADLAPRELVIGVCIDGHARAYPINQLTGPSREIINDSLGKIPIAATW